MPPSNCDARVVRRSGRPIFNGCLRGRLPCQRRFRRLNGPGIAASALEAAGSLHQIDERWQAGTIVNRQCCDRRHRPSNVCTKRKRCLFRDTHETVNVGTMSPAAGPLTCQPSPSVEERPLMLFGPAVGNTKLLFIWMMERVLRISGADCTMGA